MSSSPSDLEALTEAYIDGTIDAAGLARLNAVLADDPAARREFSERLNLDSALAAAAAGWPDDEAATRGPARPRFPAVTRRLALAACGTILLTGGALVWRFALRPPFATVEQSLGIPALPTGTKLRGAPQAIDEGTLQLVTPRGARIVIEAPAEFRFETAQRLHMLRGRLAADVPPAAKGFTVITPSGDAVDLGTRFGVDVPPDGTAEVHVFEGEVVAVPAGPGGDRNLLAGDALSMDRESSAARHLRSAAFIQSDELRELAATPLAGRIARSQAALAALRRDPDLIALLDFEQPAESHPGTFRMVQGRWPGSRAPEFVNDGDHLQLEVGGDRAWPRLTLAAWVRLDHLGAMYQSLLHTNGWDQEYFGRVHWMVNQASTMRFAMWGNTLAPGSEETQLYPDSRTPVLSDRGRWIHLATVYDSTEGTVRFYFNGRFDKEARQSVAHPARLGAAQIGNWNREERKLSGRVDELVILGRALSDDEVRSLYEAGNPYL